MKFTSDGEVAKRIREKVDNVERTRRLATIAFFDLTGSTQLKTTAGHERGVMDALKTVLLASETVQRHHGAVIKELGDGVLSCFDDPLEACLAALTIKKASAQLGITITAGLTIGSVDTVKISDRQDLYGSAVDRCARIASFSLPGQILIDRTLYDVVGTRLIDYSNVICGRPVRRILKGIGEVELYELSSRRMGLRQYVHTRFRVHEEGRLAIADKVYFVQAATTKVIEVGTGLTTFSRYFSGHRPSEFRDYVERLLAKGIVLILLVIDPEWPGLKAYLNDRDERSYADDIRGSLDRLGEERERLQAQGLPGRFDILLYRSIPFSHVLCVDPEDELAGRMLYSPYSYGVTRAESPVFEFSRLSNPELFTKQWQSIEAIMRDCSRALL